jgi:hypothetical protein
MVMPGADLQSGGGDPLRDRVCGCAQDPDASSGMLDDPEVEQARAGQGAGLEESAGEQCVRLAPEVGSGRVLRFGCVRDAVLAEDPLTVEAATLMPRAPSPPWIRRSPQEAFFRWRRARISASLAQSLIGSRRSMANAFVTHK